MAIVTLKGFNQTCNRLSTKLFQEKDKAGNQKEKARKQGKEKFEIS
jgi:hypothetical protein